MHIPIFKNTFTNYISVAVRFIQGIVVTRLMLSSLGTQQYGLWTLLWAFFCYGLLLDFGMGLAAKKITAEGAYNEDLPRYNRALSTIFCFHLAMSPVILLCTLVGMRYAAVLFHLQDASPEMLALSRKCLLIFGIGAAINFPFGLFKEVIVGLQKIYLRNYITITSQVIEVAGYILLLSLGCGLPAIVIYCMLVPFATNIAIMIACCRAIPGLRVLPRLDGAQFRRLFHFSGFVYISSLANQLWSYAGHMLLSLFDGLPTVSEYHVGSRIPGMVAQFSVPYQENVSPLAAALYHRGHKTILSHVMLNSLRWNSFLATGLGAAVCLLADVLVRFLFGTENDLDINATARICQAMMAAFYITLVMRAIPDIYLMMTGKHRFISIVKIIETVLHIIVSSALIWGFSNIGGMAIVISSCVAKGVMTIIAVGPEFLQRNCLKLRSVCWQVCLKPFIAVLPTCAVLLAIRHFALPHCRDAVIVLLAALIAAPVYLVSAWVLLFRRSERRMLLKRTGKLFGH